MYLKAWGIVALQVLTHIVILCLPSHSTASLGCGCWIPQLLPQICAKQLLLPSRSDWELGPCRQALGLIFYTVTRWTSHSDVQSPYLQLDSDPTLLWMMLSLLSCLSFLEVCRKDFHISASLMQGLWCQNEVQLPLLLGNRLYTVWTVAVMKTGSATCSPLLLCLCHACLHGRNIWTPRPYLYLCGGSPWRICPRQQVTCPHWGVGQQGKTLVKCHHTVIAPKWNQVCGKYLHHPCTCTCMCTHAACTDA